jgi:formylglycine-generating enzyme required for sulfatase activity
MFFYAGHGVQANGENYLIPADAGIDTEAQLKRKALALQYVLDELQTAGNALNMIVLDACRDNPFSWARGSSRGLQVVSNPPAESIIVYATSAGKTAADGEGRNGLFTSQLLKNLKTPGLEVSDMFRRTGSDVKRISNNVQSPEIRLNFFETAYLSGKQPVNPPPSPTPTHTPTPVASTGSVSVTSGIAGVIMIDGKETSRRIKAEGSAEISGVETGRTEVAVKGDDGKVTRARESVVVVAGRTVSAVIERPAPEGMVRINSGTFTMGSPASEKERYDWEGPQHQVTISKGFWMGKYEVTQKEWVAVMGSNPSYFKGDNLPVEQVSWNDVIDYCNKRSVKEGLTPAYTVSGSEVRWDKNASGYRLPTEAEWEYACRAGTSTPFSTGSNVTTNQANYNGNYPYNGNAKGTYREKTWAVGSGTANAWGLHDMHGNVYEWCWDWYEDYSSGAQTDPAGAIVGVYRVLRGGSWCDYARDLRSVRRVYYAPSGINYLNGFRLVRP